MFKGLKFNFYNRPRKQGLLLCRFSPFYFNFRFAFMLVDWAWKYNTHWLVNGSIKYHRKTSQDSVCFVRWRVADRSANKKWIYCRRAFVGLSFMTSTCSMAMAYPCIHVAPKAGLEFSSFLHPLFAHFFLTYIFTTLAFWLHSPDAVVPKWLVSTSRFAFSASLATNLITPITLVQVFSTSILK